MGAAADRPVHHSQDRGVARKHAFLLAAREVFLEQGYEAASVNDVVRRAGGSLATLYAQFGNKEGLFLAVTQDQHDRFVQDITPKAVDGENFEEMLQRTGEQWVRALLARDHLAFYRIFIGEGRKFPHLLQRFLATGGERVRSILADELRGWGKRAGKDVGDADLLSGYFFDLVRSRLHYRALAEPAFTVSDEEVSEHVRHAVRFFLGGLDSRAAK
ncbi:MAG: TetR/AcrR family transcriptional regulator [Hyphomonadaceae bacterium]